MQTLTLLLHSFLLHFKVDHYVNKALYKHCKCRIENETLIQYKMTQTPYICGSIRKGVKDENRIILKLICFLTYDSEVDLGDS